MTNKEIKTTIRALVHPGMRSLTVSTVALQLGLPERDVCRVCDELLREGVLRRCGRYARGWVYFR